MTQDMSDNLNFKLMEYPDGSAPRLIRVNQYVSSISTCPCNLIPVSPKHCERYAAVLLDTGLGRRQSAGLGLLDTGNTLTQPVISEEYHHSLGFSMTKTKLKVHSADHNPLIVIGMSEGLLLRFAGSHSSFFIQPLIIRDLDCQMNVGSKFIF